MLAIHRQGGELRDWNCTVMPEIKQHAHFTGEKDSAVRASRNNTSWARASREHCPRSVITNGRYHVVTIKGRVVTGEDNHKPDVSRLDVA